MRFTIAQHLLRYRPSEILDVCQHIRLRCSSGLWPCICRTLVNLEMQISALKKFINDLSPRLRFVIELLWLDDVRPLRHIPLKEFILQVNASFNPMKGDGGHVPQLVVDRYPLHEAGVGGD